MSRTLTSIALVAAAVAVNVIPGVGQVLSAAMIASITTAGVAAGLSLGASLLGLGPSAPKPETTETAIKTPRPPRVSAYGTSRLWGAYALYETSGNGTAVDVYAVHDGEMDGVVARYLGDEQINLVGSTVSEGADGRYRDGAVSLYTTTGAAVGTAFAAVTSLLSGIWTAAHRGDGVVMMALTAKSVKAKRFQETYPQSQVPVPSLAARWQKCPDPAAVDPTDQAAWTWTENPVRQLLHYKLVREAADYATKIEPAIDSWIAAAADCDIATGLAAGGTEARYRSCVVHKHTDPHKAVTGALLATFDGWIAPRSDGALVVYSGRYYEPTVSIGPDEIIAYNWDGIGIDDDQAVNEVICSYVSAEHDYATVECDAWRDEDDISARGQVLSQPLEAQVSSHAQARRLAKRKMARIMALNRGTVTTNVAGRIARGERYIDLHIEEAGTVFYSGPAEITALTRNMSTGGVTFSWVAADPNVDAWNPATEEGATAAKGNRIAADPLDAPVITAAIVSSTGATEEGFGARIQITVSGPDREDLTWYARWRRDGGSAWNEQEYSDIDPGPSVTLETGFVPVDAIIEVEAAYQIGDRRVSPWSSPPTEVDTDTDAEVPPAAVAITLTSWGDSINLSTSPIARASTYRWRFYEDDGTTLVRTIVTSGRSVSYTADQAASDGPLRSYIVDVAGVNGAGAGTEIATGIISKAAPAQVTGVVATGGATTASIAFDLLTPDGDLAGYVIYYSTAAAFDPLIEGHHVHNLGNSPQEIYGLDADTYYVKAAAYDNWTDSPDLLNFSTEDDFVITVGGGGTGGGGGGYCVTADTPILMADQTYKPAGEIAIGDEVWTQHETTMEWGIYPVEAVDVVESDDVWQALRIRGTGNHRVWLDGWVRLRDIGAPVAPAQVVRITVADAHTYISAGILSHNVKPI